MLLIVITLAALCPVCVHEFTSWDDHLNVTANPVLNPPEWRRLRFVWTHSIHEEYIPLSYSVWWVLARVAHLDAPDPSGIWLDPYVFHTANLLLHLAAALVVYQLLASLTRRPWAAWAGAMLFAIHPLQVEAVAWVTGLKDVLCGLLSLVALWQYVRFAQSQYGMPSIPSPGTPGGASGSGDCPRAGKGGGSSVATEAWLRYAGATVALVLALLAKPSAVSVPVMAAVIDLVLLKRPWRRVAVALLPWFAIAGAFVLVGLLSQPAGELPEDARSPAWLRPLIAADALAFYVTKVVLPARFGILYARAPQWAISHGWLWFTWLVPASLLAIAWAYRRQAPWGLAAVLLLFAAPAAVLGLVPFDFQRHSTVADRYVYVGMIGPALALAFALTSLPTGRRAIWASWGAVGACLALLAGRTLAQTFTWQDSFTLFRHALAVNPHDDAAYANLAADELAVGRVAEADALARQSIAQNPKQVSAYLILGSALQKEGRPREEQEAYRRACENDPHNAMALSDLAAVVAEDPTGDKPSHLAEAAELCRRAIAVEPTDPSPHAVLAAVLAAQRNDAGALVEARTAVDLNPNDVPSHIRLGQLLARAGQFSQAADQFTAALRLDPNASEAKQGLDKLKQPAR
ncbi:MAG TPA: tetratricopeptide repeat protein [Tepidisphaeraceae bacterium]